MSSPHTYTKRNVKRSPQILARTARRSVITFVILKICFMKRGKNNDMRGGGGGKQFPLEEGGSKIAIETWRLMVLFFR